MLKFPLDRNIWLSQYVDAVLFYKSHASRNRFTRKKPYPVDFVMGVQIYHIRKKLHYTVIFQTPPRRLNPIRSLKDDVTINPSYVFNMRWYCPQSNIQQS